MVRRSVTAFSRTSPSQLAVWSTKKSSFEIGCHIRSAMHRSPPCPSEPGTHRSHLAMGVARLPLATRFLTAPQPSEHGRGHRAPSRQVIERSLNGAPQHHSRRLCCLPGSATDRRLWRGTTGDRCPRTRGHIDLGHRPRCAVPGRPPLVSVLSVHIGEKRDSNPSTKARRGCEQEVRGRCRWPSPSRPHWPTHPTGQPPPLVPTPPPGGTRSVRARVPGRSGGDGIRTHDFFDATEAL